MKNLSIFIVTLMVIVLLAAIESQAGSFEKRYSRQQDRIDNGEHMRFERRHDMANRHIYRYKHDRMERRDRHNYDYEEISFKRSTVLVPLILPPFPPPPLIFPGIHIMFHSSR